MRTEVLVACRFKFCVPKVTGCKVTVVCVCETVHLGDVPFFQSRRKIISHRSNKEEIHIKIMFSDYLNGL